MFRGAARIVAVVALVPVLTVARATPARGDSSPEPKLGIDLGLQVGYGLPFGNVRADPDQPIDEIVAGVVPVAIDASYRLDDLVAVGLLVQYGIVRFQDTEAGCPSGASCSGFLLNTAAQVTLRAPVPWVVVPWIRLGGGYEWLHLRLTSDLGGPTDIRATLRGVMFGLVQAGADYRVSEAFAVGPIVSFSVGRYDFQSVSGTMAGVGLPDGGAMAVPNRAAHEWLMFGVRGVFHF